MKRDIVQTGAIIDLTDRNNAFIVLETRVYMYMGALRAYIHIYPGFPVEECIATVSEVTIRICLLNNHL